MKEFINKLIGRLEELYDRNDKTKKIAYEEQDWEKFDLFTHRCEGIYSAIAIVNELAEEYINTSTDTSSGWIEKLLEAKENCSEDSRCSECPFGQIQDRCILAELQIKGGNNGWIPCEKELPPQPKENPLFEYKPLEVYLVSLSSTDYPWRAFWNGKYFTDGFSKIEPIAWMPLPAPHKEGE